MPGLEVVTGWAGLSPLAGRLSPLVGLLSPLVRVLSPLVALLSPLKSCLSPLIHFHTKSPLIWIYFENRSEVIYLTTDLEAHKQLNYMHIFSEFLNILYFMFKLSSLLLKKTMRSTLGALLFFCSIVLSFILVLSTVS